MTGQRTHADRTDTEATIAVEDISVSFGDLDVLEDVSLSVASGEFLGLVGPNGAGKTTLARAINGVFEPAGGTVRLDGTPVADLGPRGVSRRVATVPQDTSVSFAFTVEDVVRMGRTPYRGRTDLTGDEADRKAVDRALERTEMVALRDRPITAVSGG
ncbi:Cobalamin import ATP-binding protein BtuD, partial [Halorhabdus tiamatea SARL4B]